MQESKYEITWERESSSKTFDDRRIGERRFGDERRCGRGCARRIRRFFLERRGVIIVYDEYGGVTRVSKLLNFLFLLRLREWRRSSEVNGFVSQAPPISAAFGVRIGRNVNRNWPRHLVADTHTHTHTSLRRIEIVFFFARDDIWAKLGRATIRGSK